MIIEEKKQYKNNQVLRCKRKTNYYFLVVLEYEHAVPSEIDFNALKA